MMKKRRVTVGLVLWMTLIMTCLMGMSASASYATTKMKYYRNQKVYGTAFRPAKEKYVYSKVVLPYDGTIAVSGTRTTAKGAKGKIDAILCNSAMRPIDVYGHAYVYYDSSRLVYQTYAVTKGTYYIRTTTKGFGGQKFQVFTWYKYRMNRYGGANSDNAAELEYNKALTGLITGTSYNQNRWFKFWVPKDLKKPVSLRIQFNGGQGKTSIQLWGPAFKNPKTYEMKPVWRNPVGLTIKLSTTVLDPRYPNNRSKAKEVGPAKGTYYVLITKDAKDKRMRFSSGGFAIKWWY